jgi:hypothetical protein
MGAVGLGQEQRAHLIVDRAEVGGQLAEVELAIDLVLDRGQRLDGRRLEADAVLAQAPAEHRRGDPGDVVVGAVDRDQRLQAQGHALKVGGDEAVDDAVAGVGDRDRRTIEAGFDSLRVAGLDGGGGGRGRRDGLHGSLQGGELGQDRVFG